MIIDRITNIQLYSELNPSISKALQYLKDTDFKIREAGKNEIEGKDIYSIISKYTTKKMEDCRLEAHRKYIDIHFMAEGTELIGYSFLDKQEQATEYDADNDFILYRGDKHYLKLEEGMFAIFYPTDLHMPGLMVDEPALVKKIVLKVKVQQIIYTFV